jgi:hypothetical protein
LRLDLGFAADDTESLTDEVADALFVEAGEMWSDTLSILAGTRVIQISRMMIQAAADVDYTQNNTTEKASQRYEHLKEELAKWQRRLDDVIVLGQGSSARFGRTTRKPARLKEYPSDGSWGW